MLPLMYVILIALLYILLMMVVTAESLFKGILIFLIGSALIALAYYLLDTPRRLRSRRMADEANQSDAASNQ
ncbi:MAG: hypothetical protein HXY27_02250 [Hydrogenophilaceae bacterium]|nr:hypothetical protein [Hydrogenophilaceae bacterium]